MAYNTKYILNFCNRKRVPIRVEIQIKDYVGEAFILVNEDDYLLDAEGRYITTNIDGAYDPDRDKNAIEGGGQPFVLTYQNDESGKSGAIRATKASMQFFENLLFNIDDLATSDETEIRTVLHYDNELEWIGYVIPDFFNVEITQNPLINLTAQDRIGILKDVSYPLFSDIVNRVRYIDIVANILKQTDLTLNINVVCQMYCNQFPDYGPADDYADYELTNPLYDGWVNEYRIATNVETEETLNCYEVLQSIMNQFNCLITQYKGEWWIVNKYDQSFGGGIRFVYDYNGQYQSMDRVEFGETNFNLINTGGQRSLIPAGAKNTVLLDHGPEMIYPLNHSLFSDSIFPAAIRHWYFNTGSSTLQMLFNIPALYNPDGSIADTYENEVRELRNNQYRITTLSGDTVNYPPVPAQVIGDSWLMQSEKFDVVTMDKKKSSFELLVRGTGKPYTALMIGMFMEIEEAGIPGVKYYFSLQNEVSDDGQSYTGNNRFVIIPDINVDTSIVVYPFGFENKFRSANVAVDQEWKVSMDIAAGSHQNYDINTAKFFFRVYPNNAFKKPEDGNNPSYNIDLTEISNVLKEIRVTFKNDNQTPKGTVFQTLLTSGKFTMPTDQKTVLFGDYQTTGQNGYFYKYREDSLSIQYNENGTRLKDWFTKYDSQINPQLMHTLRQMTYAYGQAHDELKIGFELGNVNPLAQFAIRCYSDKRIIVNPEDEFLLDGRNRYITSRIGRYLNNKRFVLVEGSIDYLRSEFDGKIAQIRTAETDHQEYIYSQFDNDDIS